MEDEVKIRVELIARSLKKSGDVINNNVTLKSKKEITEND